MSAYISNNGIIQLADSFSLPHTSRTFLYGIGFFETMRWQDGAIRLWPLHLQRIEQALTLLSSKLYVGLAPHDILRLVQELVEKSDSPNSLRIRAMFYELSEASELHLFIETSAVNTALHALPPHRLLVSNTPFPFHQFSAIKHNSYAAYMYAWQSAQRQRCSDSILLNQRQEVMETSRCNIFMATASGAILTPTLSSGCVAGVGRAHILAQAKRQGGITITEQSFTMDDVYAAGEVVLTNALHGVQRVQQAGNATYASRLLYATLSRLWNSHD